jgi:hypothetical protein
MPVRSGSIDPEVLPMLMIRRCRCGVHRWRTTRPQPSGALVQRHLSVSICRDMATGPDLPRQHFDPKLMAEKVAVNDRLLAHARAVKMCCF